MQLISGLLEIITDILPIIPGILPEKVWNVIAVLFWIGIFISLVILVKYLIFR